MPFLPAVSGDVNVGRADRFVFPAPALRREAALFALSPDPPPSRPVPAAAAEAATALIASSSDTVGTLVEDAVTGRLPAAFVLGDGGVVPRFAEVVVVAVGRLFVAVVVWALPATSSAASLAVLVA